MVRYRSRAACEELCKMAILADHTGHGSTVRRAKFSHMQLFPEESATIVGSARALRAGQTTCLDLVDSCLARIDEWETRVHAWVSIDRDGARQRARELDQETQDGRWRGPLHGIPLGIKDIIDIAGLPTGAGSRQRAQLQVSGDA